MGWRAGGQVAHLHMLQTSRFAKLLFWHFWHCQSPGLTSRPRMPGWPEACWIDMASAGFGAAVRTAGAEF